MSSLLKEEIRALVDDIPESDLNSARRYLEYLRDAGDTLNAEELVRLDADVAISLAEASAGKKHVAEHVIAHLRTLG